MSRWRPDRARIPSVGGAGEYRRSETPAAARRAQRAAPLRRQRVDLRPAGATEGPDREVREAAVVRRAVPVHLAGGHVDDVSRPDEVALVFGGEDAAALDAVQDLRRLVGVEVGARAGAERHDDDIDAVRLAEQRLYSRLADEV